METSCYSRIIIYNGSQYNASKGRLIIMNVPEGMKTSQEVCQLLGITKRTLRYYNEKSLVVPTVMKVVSDKYQWWFYDDEAIEKLWYIKLLQALDDKYDPEKKFNLNEIKTLFDKDDFDIRTEIARQIPALQKKRDEYNSLINFAESVKMSGFLAIPQFTYGRDKIISFMDYAEYAYAPIGKSVRDRIATRTPEDERRVQNELRRKCYELISLNTQETLDDSDLLNAGNSLLDYFSCNYTVITPAFLFCFLFQFVLDKDNSLAQTVISKIGGTDNFQRMIEAVSYWYLLRIRALLTPFTSVSETDVTSDVGKQLIAPVCNLLCQMTSSSANPTILIIVDPLIKEMDIQNDIKECFLEEIDQSTICKAVLAATYHYIDVIKSYIHNIGKLKTLPIDNPEVENQVAKYVRYLQREFSFSKVIELINHGNQLCDSFVQEVIDTGVEPGTTAYAAKAIIAYGHRLLEKHDLST